MINCKYGMNKKGVDVTNIVLSKFRQNNIIFLASGNKHFDRFFPDVAIGQIKTLELRVGDDIHKIIETDMEEYSIKIPIFCEYTSENKFVNVTNIILTDFVKNNNIIFNSGNKYFNDYFVDPNPGSEKVLKIHIGDQTHDISENDMDEHIIDIPDDLKMYIMI